MVKRLIKKSLGIKDRPQNLTGTLNEKTRLLWVEKTLKNLKAGGRILDAGAGEQQFKKFCTHLTYVSQDFGKYNPTEEKTGLQVQNWDYGTLDHTCDIADIPEPDASFDAVMCTEVFEHIVNPREAISEFSRLLKKDGYLIITAPFCSLTHFAPYHFYTGFSRYFYETELRAKGFEIIETSPNGNYFEYIAQELRRLESMSEQYASRKLEKNETKHITKLLDIISELSLKDKNSSELLCFGYHILARRTEKQND